MNGVEWIVEAHGCDAAALADRERLRAFFDSVVAGMDLHPVGETQWHQFPVTGGITGLCLLAESHLACHTFPEHSSLCLNLFCCRPRPEWDFARALAGHFAAARVAVRRVERPFADDQRELSELRSADPVSVV